LDHATVSQSTLHVVGQRFTIGEQVIWAGRPEPRVRFPWPSKIVVPLSKVTLPVFILAWIFGVAIDDRVLYLAMTVGILITGVVVVGMKGIRALPLEYEEYVLTNRCAFSHFSCNGVSILGEIVLDSQTSIRQQRCGQGNKSLVFARARNPDSVGRFGRTKTGPKTYVGFVNLKDAEYPMKLAEWVVGSNAAYQASAAAVSTYREQAWMQN
jgi:hypothetical protein